MKYLHLLLSFRADGYRSLGGSQVFYADQSVFENIMSLCFCLRRSIYARSLDELREKEEQLVVDRHDGIKYDDKSLTVNDVFDMWCELKQQSVAYANLRQNDNEVHGDIQA